MYEITNTVWLLYVYFVDEFVMIHASYLSHISEDVIIAPESKLNDGVIWLLVIKNGISRTTFLQVSESLLNNIFENFSITIRI